jgi:predicted nucleic acid-binding protein
MRYAIIDSSAYIDHWEGRAIGLDAVRQGFVVRQSSVVLSELRRGARSLAARRLVDSLRRLASEIWAPTDEDWWRAGELIRVVGDAEGWETAKRREFQNDALIALTAHRHGAAIVTSNPKDFRLLSERIRFKLIDARASR